MADLDADCFLPPAFNLLARWTYTELSQRGHVSAVRKGFTPMLSAKELYILNLEALDHIGMRVGQVSNWDDVSQPSKDYFGYLVRVINLHYTGSLSGNGITLHASDTSTLEGFLVALTAMPKEQRQKVYEFLYDMEHRIYAR